MKCLHSIVKVVKLCIIITISTCCVFMVYYFCSRIFIADQFIIPTWSMAPTLVPGDRVVVNKLIMGPMYIPRDGDIIQLTAKDGIIYKSLLEYETGKTVTIDWDRNCVFVDGCCLTSCDANACNFSKEDEKCATYAVRGSH